jgi:hypothetical protein
MSLALSFFLLHHVSSFCFLLALLVTTAHGASIMLRSVDGSWRALPHAPGDIVPVALKNNNDLAYLVSLHPFFIRDQVVHFCDRA